MKKIVLFLMIILLCGSVFGQARERVLKVERSRDGLFKGEIYNAKLQDVAAMLNTKTGPKIEVDESVKDVIKQIPYDYPFENVDALGLLQVLTAGVTSSEDTYLKYRKIQGENKYVIEPMGVNTSGEDITEDDLAEYYDTTVVNPDPTNTQRIVFQNGLVISGKLIPTSQRATGSKWTVVKDGQEYTKTVAEILPGKKIEFIENELLLKTMYGPFDENIQYLESLNWLGCKVINKGKFIFLKVPTDSNITDKIQEFIKIRMFAQPNGIGPLTITQEDVNPYPRKEYLPGTPAKFRIEGRGHYFEGLINLEYKQKTSYLETLYFNNKYGALFTYLSLENNRVYGSVLFPLKEDTLLKANELKNDSKIIRVELEGVVTPEP